MMRAQLLVIGKVHVEVVSRCRIDNTNRTSHLPLQLIDGFEEEAILMMNAISQRRRLFTALFHTYSGTFS